MGKLKVGVIGCGSIAQKRHLIEYDANEHTEIVAVCDVVKNRAKEIGEKYQAQAFTDYEELLKLEEIDVISVCLPNYLHAPVSVASLKAGKHVLCEKPMATTVMEANEMIQAAEESDKTLMIGHNQRFVSSHQKAKQLIDSGEVGKVYSFRTTFGHGGPEGWSIDGKESWFFNGEQAVIGALGDLGVHKADLIRYLLGEVSEVGAMVETSAKDHSQVDDNAVSILKMENGAIGTLTASWSYKMSGDNSTVIYGEKAILRLEEDPDYSLIVQYTNGEVVKYELDKIQTNEEAGQTDSHVIDHFVDCILNNKPPLITGEEGKRSLEVILASLESKEEKRIIKL
ncbi:Gfo/Idh/MocA family protein [Oceanobacillus sp. FSL H7-0719]|uniref:Gfo/Idh/MocA family protein n=1 Tax=Oceanobacillus sp. FSL H7-0719 TaxID=2954507 RepID=UPI0032467F60